MLKMRWGGFCVVMTLVLAAAAQAQPLELERRSAERFAGKLQGSEVRFSAVVEAPELVAVEVELTSRTRIEAEVDYLTERFFVRSVVGASALAPLAAGDVTDLRSLQEALGAPEAPLGELLARVLLLVSEYPADAVVDLRSSGASRRSSAEAVVSLCAQTGQQRTGRYDVPGKNHTETVQLGPCYNSNNDCMGRCGPGCTFPPISTIQVFAQDCLNHDLCKRKTGNNFGPCQDEWNAAADDYLFGRDCARLRDQWTDNFDFLWNPRENGGVVSGSVDTNPCRYSVSGVHNGAAVQLVARTGNSTCCPSFTYRGRFRGCHRMSGTWTNTCGFSGNWVMSKAQTASLDALWESLGVGDPQEPRPNDGAAIGGGAGGDAGSVDLAAEPR